MQKRNDKLQKDMNDLCIKDFSGIIWLTLFSDCYFYGNGIDWNSGKKVDKTYINFYFFNWNC